jgi:hypothetical protein
LLASILLQLDVMQHKFYSLVCRPFYCNHVALMQRCNPT